MEYENHMISLFSIDRRDEKKKESNHKRGRFQLRLCSFLWVPVSGT